MCIVCKRNPSIAGMGGAPCQPCYAKASTSPEAWRKYMLGMRQYHMDMVKKIDHDMCRAGFFPPNDPCCFEAEGSCKHV